jgi:DNA polymerase/3'-5' exonuclease PolX
MDAKIREVYGIGAKKAEELRKNYNVRSVSTLRKLVRKIPTIVNESQKIGLKYHNRIIKKIPYKEITKHVKFIHKHLPRATIAGSYRREDKMVNDIDVLIMSDLKVAVNKLQEKKYIVAILVYGEEKFSGIVQLPNTTNFRRIDIIRTTKEEKPFALLYFTGDFVQNIVMRTKAKKMKYILSQHGLKSIKTGKYVKGIKTERDIFNFLKLPYKSPKERSHKSMIKVISSQKKTAGKKSINKKTACKKSTKKKL